MERKPELEKQTLTGRLRARLARRLRHQFGVKLYPSRSGSGLVPWMASSQIRTRLLFHARGQPTLMQKKIPVSIRQFSKTGAVLERFDLELKGDAVLPFEIPVSSESLEYGYCLLTGTGRGDIPFPLQTYFQFIGPETYALSHGRPKGVVEFPDKSFLSNIIKLIEPSPYNVDTVQPPYRSLTNSFLLMNVSNRRGFVSARYDGIKGRVISLTKHGSYLLDSEYPEAELVNFVGSVPFTFYKISSGFPDRRFSVQHILDTF